MGSSFLSLCYHMGDAFFSKRDLMGDAFFNKKDHIRLVQEFRG